jgi:uncharacterized protein YcfJ
MAQILMPQPRPQQTQAPHKGWGDIAGKLLGTVGAVAGGIAGTGVGGPGAGTVAGAIGGFSAGQGVGNALGEAIRPTKQAEYTQSQVPQVNDNAVGRRFAQIDSDPMFAMTQAKASLAQMPPEYKQRYEPIIDDAMNVYQQQQKQQRFA